MGLSKRASAAAQLTGNAVHTEMGMPAMPGEAPSRIERRADRTRTASQADEGQVPRGKCPPNFEAHKAA